MAGKGPSAARGQVEIAGDPIVRAALEHHVLDAVPVALEAAGGQRMQGSLLGKPSEHFDGGLSDKPVASFQIGGRSEAGALFIPARVQLVEASRQVAEQHAGVFARVGGAREKLGALSRPAQTAKTKGQRRGLHQKGSSISF